VIRETNGRIFGLIRISGRHCYTDIRIPVKQVASGRRKERCDMPGQGSAYLRVRWSFCCTTSLGGLCLCSASARCSALLSSATSELSSRVACFLHQFISVTSWAVYQKFSPERR